MSTRGRRLAVSIILFIGILTASVITCSPGDDFSPTTLTQQAEEEKQRQLGEVYQRLIGDSETEQAKMRYRIGLTQTAVAAIETDRAAVALTEAARQFTPHPPSIVGIDFPSTVPADDTTVPGTIRFKDTGGDVNLVSIQTLQGLFPSHSWDPGNTITWAGDRGTIPFGAKCGHHEYVLARVTLRDAAGNTSAPVDISFYCI